MIIPIFEGIQDEMGRIRPTLAATNTRCSTKVVFETESDLDVSDWAKPNYTKIEDVLKKRAEFGSSMGI